MTKKKNHLMEDMPHLDQESIAVKKKSNRINVHKKTSDKRGFAGFVETLLRSFKPAAFALALTPMIAIYIISIGISLTPGFLLTQYVYQLSAHFNQVIHALVVSTAFATSYFIYGIVLIFVIPLFNKLLCLKLKPWRGSWFSLQTLPWYYHNALVQLVRYTFLDLITPTPLNILFFRMMGMKIGKGVMINTSNISDPCLITLEDYVTIGGSATIFAHYAQAGFLVLEPVIIKKGATVGLKASIMGDVIVGEKVTVKPHSILLPKTRLNKGDKQ